MRISPDDGKDTNFGKNPQLGEKAVKCIGIQNHYLTKVDHFCDL